MVEAWLIIHINCDRKLTLVLWRQACYGAVLCPDQRQQHPQHGEGASGVPWEMWSRIQVWLLVQPCTGCWKVRAFAVVHSRLLMAVCSTWMSIIVWTSPSLHLDILHHRHHHVLHQTSFRHLPVLLFCVLAEFWVSWIMHYTLCVSQNSTSF